MLPARSEAVAEERQEGRTSTRTRPSAEREELFLDLKGRGRIRVVEYKGPEGAPTLIHGDSHLGNLLLDGEEIGFLDWACTAKAPGIRDVGYFLSNSIPTELRRDQERELLTRYLASLERAGGTPTSFEEAWREYRLHVASGWVAATVTAAAGSRMQALEIGLRSMKRATAAIADLETPELLGRELGLS